MKDIIPARKQSPLLGLSGMGGGVGSNIVAGGAEKVYGEDIFSTYLYKGTNAANTVNTGLDMSGEGGLLWIKSRNSNRSHQLFDTVRGANKRISSDTFLAEGDDSNRNQTFTTTGFTLNNTYTDLNDNNVTYSSWNFRKAKGFFDIVKYDGNATSSSSPARQIAHNLGSVPGCIMIKCTTQNQSWAVYHRGIGNTKYLGLNGTTSATTSSAYWGDTDPTSTHFTVKHDGQVNENGHEYVAYIFAGGESTAATARSVDFDGNQDNLTFTSSSDFAYGTGDFTIECWIYLRANTTAFVLTDDASGGGEGYLYLAGQGTGVFNAIYAPQNGGGTLNSGTQANDLLGIKQWHHIAISRSSGTSRMFINGILRSTNSDTQNYGNQAIRIGGREDGTDHMNGLISNVRIVKGTALYTSSFKPSTEPLTNVTNTKLLCCNNSSLTGGTVLPNTPTANGNPVASTDSPFDDPDGFKFGEEGDQNMIKTGSYTGNGNNNGPEIYLGWEPQWLIFKTADEARDWKMVDTMRGAPTGTGDNAFNANEAEAESGNQDVVDILPTGFRITNNNPAYNDSEGTITYIAIRRLDPLVTKPIEAATEVFAMATGNGSSNIPNFTSGFPVDFGFYKTPASSGNWESGSRLSQGNYLYLNRTDAEGQWANMVFDSNVGWQNHSSHGSNYQSWMWKRYAGFDVVHYNFPTASGFYNLKHNLSKTPEMIWQKHRTTSDTWVIYHKDLNGGADPKNYYMEFNQNAEGTLGNVNYWGRSGTLTSDYFEINGQYRYTGATQYILFASVDGISKVGSYTGNGSTTGPIITTGFNPRFILLKDRGSGGTNWYTLDTLRGLGSGNDKRLQINETSQQDTGDYIDTSSTGFQLKTDWDQFNGNGANYIYYAHA